MIILRDYQKQVVDLAHCIIAKKKLVYIAAETRTGKTLMALRISDLRDSKSVLFVTKKRAIKSIKKDYKLLKPNFKLTVINYESLHKLTTHDFDLVIIDEAHTLGAFPKASQRTRRLQAICINKPIIFLSATPTPESFSSLYHELSISSFSPWRQYKNFYHWARDYVNIKKQFINTHNFTIYTEAKKEKVLADFEPLRVSLTQKEAGFNFEIDEQIINCPVPDQIQKYFDDLRKNDFLIIDEKEITADSPAKKKSKVHQLSSGSLITDTREHLLISTYKAKYLDVFMRSKNIKKAIVFYKYKSELELLKGYFYPWIVTDPEVFQRCDQCDRVIFTAQYLSGREGIRLDTSDAVFFFSPDFAYLSYEQAKNRLQDLDREKTPVLYWMMGLPVDRSIMDTVKNKDDYTATHFKREFLK